MKLKISKTQKKRFENLRQSLLGKDVRIETSRLALLTGGDESTAAASDWDDGNNGGGGYDNCTGSGCNAMCHFSCVGQSCHGACMDICGSTAMMS